MHSIIVDDVSYSVDARTYSIIRWLIEHAGEIPELGNLQINLTAGRFTPQVLTTFAPVPIVEKTN